MIQDGYLFKSTRLCIPKSGTKELLIQEVHSGSLASHYGENKILSMLQEQYYWPAMSKDVQDILKSCVTCQVAKMHLLPQGLSM